jgi:chemotaxis protein MotB
MRRRRHSETHENHERWLVSYADFITLLFAFFVVMFANSQVDRTKAAKIAESVKGALESGSMPASIQGFLGRARDVKPEERGMGNAPGSWHPESLAVESQAMSLLPSLRTLEKQFAAEIAEGKIQVEMTARGIVVTMREAAFFQPGDDRIQASSIPMIAKVAETVRALPNPVRMEGHTDSVPIRTERFRSNWELSAARAIAMMELMTSRFGVPPAKVAIAGYADTAPVAPNDTAEGRAKNRRVDVIILSQLGQAAEPGASKP